MRRNKRGASLAEAVVAITVITIVSVAALSTILFSINAQRKVINYTEAQNFAASVYESFQATDDKFSNIQDVQDSFVSNVEFAEGVKLAEEGSKGDVYKYTYSSDTHNFQAIIEVNFTNGKISINVIDADDSGSIIQLEYTKGGQS